MILLIYSEALKSKTEVVEVFNSENEAQALGEFRRHCGEEVNPPSTPHGYRLVSVNENSAKKGDDLSAFTQIGEWSWEGEFQKLRDVSYFSVERSGGGDWVCDSVSMCQYKLDEIDFIPNIREDAKNRIRQKINEGHEGIVTINIT